MRLQPPDIKSDRLFRLLLETPRPKQALEFKITGVSNTLYVQALSSHEVADLSNDNLSAQILTKCLVLKSGKPAFSSAEKLGSVLSMAEFKELNREVSQVMSTISPMLGYCDQAAWNQKLEEGAKHPSNFSLVYSLGMCFDFIVLPDKIISKDHPETFFGIPRKELLDCHWMAYWSARKIYKEMVLGEGNEQQTVEDLKKITKGEKLWATLPTTQN